MYLRLVGFAWYSDKWGRRYKIRVVFRYTTIQSFQCSVAYSVLLDELKEFEIENCQITL